MRKIDHAHHTEDDCEIERHQTINEAEQDITGKNVEPERYISATQASGVKTASPPSCRF
jgi:hypothetical protein